MKSKSTISTPLTYNWCPNCTNLFSTKKPVVFMRRWNNKKWTAVIAAQQKIFSSSFRFFAFWRQSYCYLNCSSVLNHVWEWIIINSLLCNWCSRYKTTVRQLNQAHADANLLLINVENFHRNRNFVWKMRLLWWFCQIFSSLKLVS